MGIFHLGSSPQLPASGHNYQTLDTFVMKISRLVKEK